MIRKESIGIGGVVAELCLCSRNKNVVSKQKFIKSLCHRFNIERKTAEKSILTAKLFGAITYSEKDGYKIKK